MKTSVTKRIMAMLLFIVMLFAVSCTTPAPTTPTAPTTPENGTKAITTETIKIYKTATDFKDITVSHYEDTPEIILLDTDTICTAFIDGVLNTRPYGFTYEETDTTLTIKKGNGSTCTIDFVNDTMSFDDFDKFTSYGFSVKADLLAYKYMDEQENSVYFKRTSSLYIAGEPVTIDLAKREIPLDIYNGKKYIPFQTFHDIFLAPHYFYYLYNSKDLFELVDGHFDESLNDLYYSLEAKPRSEALIKYTTKQMCLYLDLFYGLKEEQLIYDDFESYIKRTGVWDDLNSPDANTSGLAVASLMYGYIADKHCGYNMISPYAGTSKISGDIKVAASLNNFYDYMDAIKKARSTVMPNGVEEYFEVGNTAYITFDNFTLDEKNRSFTEYTENSRTLTDTIGIIIRAHEQITRENSPIENVVLDLSCNTGGAVDSAIYVVAWMLGYCDFHNTNPITGGYSTASFQVDVNLDGVFDKNDTVADKNLYCLISPTSFSCGNLVPALFKESGMVTLLGGTSGGGACAVQLAAAADGSYFQISSPYKFSTDINGSYYHVDQGVEPHYFFSKFESYFERNTLTQYINNLI